MLEAQSRILEGVRAGASIDEAARQAGSAVGTVRRWLTEGRKAPEGRYGEFAREVDAVRAGQRVVLADRPMTYEEVELVLTAAIRRGSLQAVKMWVALHPHDGAPPADDPFAEFDPV